MMALLYALVSENAGGFDDNFGEVIHFALTERLAASGGQFHLPGGGEESSVHRFVRDASVARS